MKLNLLDQSLTLFLLVTFIQCDDQQQNTMVTTKVLLSFGHNVLQNGRVISEPVSYLFKILIS